MAQDAAREAASTVQAAATQPEPQQQHRWLHNLIGEWTYASEMPAEPGQQPVEVTGTESVRSLGGLWILAEGEGEMPGGGKGITLMTLGYDTQAGRFVGSFIGSMMTNLWVYDSGELDQAGRVLALNTVGPRMSGEGTTKYRDIIELKSDDHRTLTATMLADDGTWQQLMTMEYWRKK